MKPSNSVFYAGVGPSLIQEGFLKAERPRSIHTDSLPSLTTRPTGTLTLHVGMRDCRCRAAFRLVCTLVVPVLLGTSFIESVASGILPRERKIVSYNSKTIPILAINESSREHERKYDRPK